VGWLRTNEDFLAAVCSYFVNWCFLAKLIVKRNYFLWINNCGGFDWLAFLLPLSTVFSSETNCEKCIFMAE